jgi:DNA-binding MarR family transcriptional regulator
LSIFVNQLVYLRSLEFFQCQHKALPGNVTKRYTASTMKSQKISAEQIQVLRQDHIGRLLLRTQRDFSDTAASKLQARGHSSLGSAAIGLIPYIDLEGTRASVLAERAGISKQAVGQLIAELEASGYVTRQPDPQDGRAATIVFTDLGWRLLRDSYNLKLEIEAEYSAILGERRMKALRDALKMLLEHGPAARH